MHFCFAGMSSKLSEVDAEAGLPSTHEVDCVPLLPLGDSVRNILPREQSTRPYLKGSSVKSNICRADSTRRTSDASEVFQCQRKYDTLNTSRPRFNTVNDFFTDEVRRLRERLDNRLHEAVAAQDIVAIERLVAAGVSPATLDHSGLTPLHLCILHKLIKPFEVLLKHEGSANVRDARGLSVLHVAVLHRWLPGVDAALAAGADITALCTARKTLYPHTFSLERYQHVSYQDFVLAFVQTPIQLATKVEDLTMLVKMLNVAEQIGVVNCYNKKGQTPLYTAIMNGNLEAVDILLKKGASVDKVSKRRETALHIAVRKPIILKYLLDTTNCPSLFSDYGYAPIHKAAFCNQPESVKLLVNKFNNIELKTVAVKSFKEDKSGGMTALHLAAKYFSNETAEVLLEMGANPNEVDDLGNTPLHVSAKAINRAMSELLLRNGAVLSAKDQHGNSALQIIATKFHDALSFFELVFDEFICTKGLYPMGTTVVCVNYEVLSRNDDLRQIKAIEEFVSYGLRKILLHPFIESLLYLKWRQLLPVFYFLIIIYALFLSSFNIFVVNVFYCKDNILDISNSSDTPSNLMKKSGELPWFEMYDKWYYLLLALLYISISLLVLQESFYIYLKRIRYFESLEAWVKLVGLVLAAGLPLTVHYVEMKAWQRHVACGALLLVWLQAMFLLSRFPGWGYYVLMFGKVAINMFKVFITSICLVVGFAFCFMIQFQTEPPFDGPISAIVKTLIMMSSEFDYEDLFGKEHDKQLQHSRTIVRLLFLVFVIFVAIVLVNFMIAVAVSDTNNLNISGNISRLEKQVDLLSSLDVLVNCGPLSKMFKKKYGGKRYHKKMYNSIKANRTWFVECSSSVEMYPQVLPSALYRAIIDIARKKDERAMKSHFKNSTKTKIDSLHDVFIGIDQNSQVKGSSPQSLRDIILKQDEKIKQLSSDIANIKGMLEDLIASQVPGKRISL